MTVAIIGAGVMGETLLAGILRGGYAVADLAVGEKRAERAEELRTAYGVQVVGNLEAAAADTVLLVVKPQDMVGVLTEVAPVLRPGQVLVSLAAGITTRLIEKHVPDGVVVVRVMPNTPALVAEGMAAISGGTHCRDEHLALTERLLASTGRVLRVPEDQQDAVTAASGSGPAYFFLVVEAMVDAAVGLGLSRETATELVVQTAYGAAALLRGTGEDAAALRTKVTSPNGTTAAAVAELEAHDLRGAFGTAMTAARDRSLALAAGLD
ncbi:MAG: pyrroline-5-carboxylate reductase [Marmoricola sp.]|nr:pyrroline-5-carboxylate reductase [Marmoricola sp.]